MTPITRTAPVAPTEIDRPAPPTVTPWGAAQHASQLAPGVWSITCAGHGGIWLSPERRRAIPLAIRQAMTASRDGAWFEEDVDVAVPFLVLDDLDPAALAPEATPARLYAILRHFKPHTAYQLAVALRRGDLEPAIR